MSIKFFEMEDGVECEVEFSYRPGRAATYYDPAEDGEVFTETDVRIYVNNKPTDQVLTWDEFIERLATDRGVEKERAEAQVLAELEDAGIQAVEDAFDDDVDDDRGIILDDEWDEEFGEMDYDIGGEDDSL